MTASKLLLATDSSLSPLVLRAALATVILPHGLQKAFGWFGGYGPAGTLRYFNGLGIPTAIGILAIVAEVAGPLALAAGLGTRLAALAVAVVMAVAALRVHAANGFFMNWFGNQRGEGVEFFLVAVALALALIVTGGGAASLDRVLSRS